MATLTIADLDNGKRDLQTVDGVANSRAASVTTRYGQQTTTLYEAIRLINEKGDAILSNLGFFVPVDYAPGLSVTEPNFTVVGPDGKIYAAQAGQLPFTTGAWNPGQWYPIQNDLNDYKLLVFGSLADAEAAATTLPDGQAVEVENDESRGGRHTKYLVNSGAVEFKDYAPDVIRLNDYAALRAYSGRASVVDITSSGIAGRFVRKAVGGSEDNGGTKITDSFGFLWERIASNEIKASWFVDDISQALPGLSKALAYHNESGMPLNLGCYEYVINDTLGFTFTRTPVIYGEGASIKLVRPTPVAEAVSLKVGRYGALLSNWKVDANNKAYAGLGVLNHEAEDMNSSALLGSVCCDRISAENVYRSGKDFIYGFGIWIYGGFSLVHLKSPRVKGVKLAAGAGVASEIGVHGLVVMNRGDAKARRVLIENPHIEDVYSEDPNWHSDQDGLQLFGPVPSSSVADDERCDIVGGVFINCWGRSIKAARPYVTVTGTHFVRNTGWEGARALMEIDFQYGGGTVNDVTYFHDGFLPERIVSSSAGNYVNEGLTVDGVRGFSAGDQVMGCIVMRTASGTHPVTKTVVRNVAHNGRWCVGLVAYDTNLNDPAETLSVEDCFINQIGSALVQTRGNVARVNLNNVVAKTPSTSIPAVEALTGAALWSAANVEGVSRRKFTGSVVGFSGATPLTDITVGNSGGFVTLDFSGITGDPSSSTTTLTIPGLPMELRPRSTVLSPARVVVSGALQTGWVSIDNQGLIAFFPTAQLGPWPGSGGLKGISDCSITYHI